MSFNHQKHLLINQLQVKPLDFIEHIKTLTDESILTFLCQIFLEGELSLFHNLILYLGQEHNSADSLYQRVLQILLQYQDDIYFYVLDNLVPIVLNFHLSNQNPYFHTSILHLSNYEPLLVKTIHFIEKTEELSNLILMVREVPQINKPLLKSIRQYDEELANYLERHINPIEQVKKMKVELDSLNHQAEEERNNSSSHEDAGQESSKSKATMSNENTEDRNNISKEEINSLKPPDSSLLEEELQNNELPEELQTKISKLNQELRELGDHPDKIESNSSNLIEQAIDDISNFSEMNHLGIQQDELEKNIDKREMKSRADSSTTDNRENENTNNNLNTNLITQVQEESRQSKTDKKLPANYEEFIGQIPLEKMELLATFTRLVDQDALMLLAKNKTYLQRELKPSCDKIQKLINKPVVISNKLGTNYKLENLASLGDKFHGNNKKPVFYFDITEALLCYGPNQIKNKISICTHHNVFSNYFYPYEKHKFGLEKQLYNLDVWLLLLQNLNFYDKLDDTKKGTLQDLYEIVIMVPKHIYQKLVSSYQEGSINMIFKNKMYLVCADDQLTPGILNFYLYMKFFQTGDILLTPDNLNYLKHGEGVALNQEYIYFEEYLPFVANDMEMLKEMLGSFYPEYNFITEKIELNSIPKKKYSKKKTYLQKKKSNFKSNKGKKPNKKEKHRKKYSRKV